MNPDDDAQPKDLAIRNELAERADEAAMEAQRLERLARELRNVEAGCHAAIEQIDRGLKAAGEIESLSTVRGIAAAGEVDPRAKGLPL